MNMSVVYCCQYNVVTFISLLYRSFFSWSSDWSALVIRSPEHASKGVVLTLNPFTSNKTNGEGDERSYTIINQIGLNVLYIYFIVEIYVFTLNKLYLKCRMKDLHVMNILSTLFSSLEPNCFFCDFCKPFTFSSSSEELLS